MSNVGTSTVDITPPLGMNFIGYHRPEGIKNINDRIYSTVFIFEHNGKKSVIISIDNIGMLVEDTMKIRKGIAKKLKIFHDNVMVLYTHTHSGPETDGSNPITKSYKTLLIENVVQATLIADENLRPCKVGWEVTTGEIGVNRREMGTDGKVKMGTNLEGVVDQRIGVLGIKHADSNKWLGMVVFCTAHPNVLKGDSSVLSADYPGKTKEILQQIFNCPVAIVQGAAGNVNARWRGTYEAVEAMAQSLSGHILTMLPKLKMKPISKLTNRSSIFLMKLKQIPDPAGIKKMGTLAAEQWGVNTDTWRDALLRKYEGNQRLLTVELEVHLVQINEGSFSGIPMEPFSESAIYIKARLKNELAFFGGYTNGYLGYLPTSEAFPFGGYEVELNPVVYGPITGLWMPPIESTSDMVINKVLELYEAHD